MKHVSDYIRDKVHELYWKYDLNCARTTLTCLSELYQIPVEPQTMTAAVGLFGAGGYRAQCGLVEGSLMFIGLYCAAKGMTESAAVSYCYQFARSFEEKFGSLQCRELRPSGFSKDDPPHMCEQMSCAAIEFTWNYIQNIENRA